MMTRNAAFERLTKVFQEVFDDETIRLTDSTVSEDIEDWDSFEHINLIVAIEKEFSFKVPAEKVLGIENVGEMVDIIMDLGY